MRQQSCVTRIGRFLSQYQSRQSMTTLWEFQTLFFRLVLCQYYFISLWQCYVTVTFYIIYIQGCNPPRGSQGNQFLCDTNSPSCGPPVAPRPNSPSVSLTCPASSNLMVGSGTQFTFRQTFVFERASAVISMPRPLVVSFFFNLRQYFRR